jgi:aspartokinase-like uncharacterized kinase
MVIVKIGGSLFASSLLNDWIEKLEQLSQQESIIIVPGGGPFANQVRQAQQQYQFPDHHAHHMAILAMAQFGIMLLGLNPQAHPFYYPIEQVDKTQAKLSVWLPDHNLLEQHINQSWDVTSDSLALWLAQQLQPSKLTLLKHQAQPQSSIQYLASQGIVDKSFPAQYAKTAALVEIFNVSKINDYTTIQPQCPLEP